MPGRGNSRGRGRGGMFKQTSRNDSVLDRLGKMAVYPKGDDRNNKKYKFVRPQAITSSIAPLPIEARIRTISRKFLKTYYDIFDAPGRANLESQYSGDAHFSFSATYPIPTCNRNLLELEPAKRLELLIQTKGNIAGALAALPPTEHLVNYLSIDIPFYIVNPMSVISLQIVVTGVFKDVSQNTNPVTAFTRVFVLKLAALDKMNEPVYEIFNDLFMISPPTPDQIKRYHQDLQTVKRLAASHPPVRPNVSSQSSDSSYRNQENIIHSIMAKTKMNKSGARQLLEECNWDEGKSLEVFEALIKSNANNIPQNFFAP